MFRRYEVALPASTVILLTKPQRLVRENQWEDHWPKLPAGDADAAGDVPADHTSPSIWRDLSKCIECGHCAEVCGETVQNQNIIGFADRGCDRRPVTIFDQPLSKTKCISCVQHTFQFGKAETVRVLRRHKRV